MIKADWRSRVSALVGIYTFSDGIETPIVRAAHGDASGVRGAARLWSAVTPRDDQRDGSFINIGHLAVSSMPPPLTVRYGYLNNFWIAIRQAARKQYRAFVETAPLGGLVAADAASIHVRRGILRERDRK